MLEKRLNYLHILSREKYHKIFVICRDDQKVYSIHLRVLHFIVCKFYLKLKKGKNCKKKKKLISYLGHACWGSLVAQMVKHLLAIQETQVQSLGWEDLLEKEMATHSSILAWRIPRMEEHGRLQSTGSQRVRHNWATSLHFIMLR